MDQLHYLFVFDLDGTLIDTDLANNLSYQFAIQKITGKTVDTSPINRITRTEIIQILPNVLPQDVRKIVAMKEKIYHNFLSRTKLNENLVLLLKLFHSLNYNTILLTNSCRHRARQLCKFYKITDLFTHQYYSEDYNTDKYHFLKDNIKIKQSIVLFENDAISILKAQQAGLPVKYSISIKF